MTKTLSDLEHQVIYLSGLIGGAEVLADEAGGSPDNPYTRMASNSLPVLFEDMRRRADALLDDLGEMERAGRSTGTT